MRGFDSSFGPKLVASPPRRLVAPCDVVSQEPRNYLTFEGVELLLARGEMVQYHETPRSPFQRARGACLHARAEELFAQSLRGHLGWASEVQALRLRAQATCLDRFVLVGADGACEPLKVNRDSPTWAPSFVVASGAEAVDEAPLDARS